MALPVDTPVEDVLGFLETLPIEALITLAEKIGQLISGRSEASELQAAAAAIDATEDELVNQGK